MITKTATRYHAYTATAEISSTVSLTQAQRDRLSDLLQSIIADAMETNLELQSLAALVLFGDIHGRSA